MAKRITVSGQFPELLAKHHFQAATAEGGTVPLAVKNALAAILKREGVKRKRIRTIKLTIIVEEATGT